MAGKEDNFEDWFPTSASSRPSGPTISDHHRRVTLSVTAYERPKPRHQRKEGSSIPKDRDNKRITFSEILKASGAGSSDIPEIYLQRGQALHKAVYRLLEARKNGMRHQERRTIMGSKIMQKYANDALHQDMFDEHDNRKPDPIETVGGAIRLANRLEKIEGGAINSFVTEKTVGIKVKSSLGNTAGIIIVRVDLISDSRFFNLKNSPVAEFLLPINLAILELARQAYYDGNHKGFGWNSLIVGNQPLNSAFLSCESSSLIVSPDQTQGENYSFKFGGKEIITNLVKTGLELLS